MNKADIMSSIQAFIESKQNELTQIESGQAQKTDSKSTGSFFRAFAEWKQIKATKKKVKETERVIKTLSALSESRLHMEAKPMLFYAYMTCNSTAVGESGDIQRTVARDYITEEYWFVEGDCRAAKKALSLFADQFDPNIKFYNSKSMATVAEYYGFREIHAPYFRSLNMHAYAHHHHLNSYAENMIGDPIFMPVYAITTQISKKCTDYLIGFVYEKNGEEHILIEPVDPKSPGSRSDGAEIPEYPKSVSFF